MRNTEKLIRKSYNKVQNKSLNVHILGCVYLFYPAWSSVWVGLKDCSAFIEVEPLSCSASKGHVHLRHLLVLNSGEHPSDVTNSEHWSMGYLKKIVLLRIRAVVYFLIIKMSSELTVSMDFFGGIFFFIPIDDNIVNRPIPNHESISFYLAILPVATVLCWLSAKKPCCMSQSWHSIT